jgi:uroporphyrinogen decarboxylase
VLENASPNFILGADCTVPGDTDWEKLRAVIDYAHSWRLTHNK